MLPSQECRQPCRRNSVITATEMILNTKFESLHCHLGRITWKQTTSKGKLEVIQATQLLTFAQATHSPGTLPDLKGQMWKWKQYPTKRQRNNENIVEIYGIYIIYWIIYWNITTALANLIASFELCWKESKDSTTLSWASHSHGMSLKPRE